YSLLLDNGTRLWPAATSVPYKPVKNQRVFLNYTILSGAQDGYDHYIKVNDIWDILTKKVIELNTQNEDSIGNDPVKTNAVWVGGDYLNISFMFNYGGVQPHAINLVKNTLVESSSSQSTVLEFRHNSYQSQQSKLYEGFVCFDLRPLRVENADSVKLSVKVKEHARETTYDVIYRYNDAVAELATEMPIPVISSNEYY
ncbi:MAG: NigD-like protein, partial [Proteiniphilum sp.]